VPFLVYSSRRQQQKWAESSDHQIMAAIQDGDEKAFD